MYKCSKCGIILKSKTQIVFRNDNTKYCIKCNDTLPEELTYEDIESKEWLKQIYNKVVNDLDKAGYAVILKKDLEYLKFKKERFDLKNQLVVNRNNMSKIIEV